MSKDEILMITQTIALLNSMVICGEDHSNQSKEAVLSAYKLLDDTEEKFQSVKCMYQKEISRLATKEKSWKRLAFDMLSNFQHEIGETKPVTEERVEAWNAWWKELTNTNVADFKL